MEFVIMAHLCDSSQECQNPPSYLVRWRNKNRTGWQHFFACTEHLPEIVTLGTAWDLSVEVVRASVAWLFLQPDGTPHKVTEEHK